MSIKIKRLNIRNEKRQTNGQNVNFFQPLTFEFPERQITKSTKRGINLNKTVGQTELICFIRIATPVSDEARKIKMISAQHWSNNAKIKLPKKPHSMVIFWIKVRRPYRDLSSQADPARDN